MTTSTRRLRTLLRWAVDFVERQADVLQACSTNAEGRYDPNDVVTEIEVADCRRWIDQAREELSR
jgi:hypothetical protein